MIINHNLAALNTIRQLGVNSNNTQKALEKLSSGLRINSAADDAAGLAISEKMRGQINGLEQAQRNAQDGISLISTAEGALNETHSILQRMRELAVQSANDTNTGDDRTKIQSEVDQLAKEITRISNDTEFNKQNLLSGNLDDTFQIGANKDQNISLSISAMDASSLGVATDAKSGTVSSSNTAQLTGVSNVGQGLADGDYSVIVTKTAASNGTVTASGGGSADTATLTGTYTGADTQNWQVKVTSVDGSGKITGVQLSTDNGVSFGSTITVSGSTPVDLGNGVKISFDGSGTNAANDTFSFTETASSATVQLADSTGATPIGSAVTVKNTDSSATIGDSTTGGTVDVSFNFSTLVASATNNTKITVATEGSHAATFDSQGNQTSSAYAAKGVDVSTQDAANKAIDTIDKAIESVSSERSNLGAYQNRLEHTINNLGTSSQNLTAAESRIRDVDYALAA